MKINKEYLKNFCEYYGIFNKKEISQENKNKINYNFGISGFYLNGVKTIRQLEKIIEKFGKHPTEAEKDFNHEILIEYGYI